jgi:membrane protease YdiL (CAAX protease family)
VPLLKPAARHSVTVSRGDAPAHAAGSPKPHRRGRSWLGVAAASLWALVLQVGAFGLAYGLVAAIGRLAAPPPGLLPFPSLSGSERALLALTVLPHAMLALLVFAARLRARTGLGFTRPVLSRRTVLLILLWPPLQVAGTALLLLLSGQSPVRAWRLSPFLTGGVLWTWILWLVVLAPLAEEMLFRGELFGRLARLLSPAATVAVSAVVFALCHAERGLLQPLSVLPLGVALGTMRLWAGSLWPCIALHAASNGAVILARVWSTG